MTRHIMIGLALIVALASLAQAQTTLYVDQNADLTPHDGADWCHAYLTLDEALAAASTNGAIDEIRVADGIYLPDTTGLGDPREATFQLLDGVAVRGGYAGCNDGGDIRDIALYETILNGDIGTPGNDSDNSYHVVTGSDTDVTAVLDGFTITGGNANGSTPNDRGGGMYNSGSSSSPMLANCTFIGNSASNRAGGMYNYHGTSPTVTNCTFIGNSTGDRGGGMYNDNDSTPTLTSCTFGGNLASSGGGMFNDNTTAPTLTNCTFSGNTANDDGGGMCNGPDSSSTLTNCTFSGNSASSDGGGMYNYDKSNPTLANCIVWGNTASNGPQIYQGGGSTTAPTVVSRAAGRAPATLMRTRNSWTPTDRMTSREPKTTTCIFHTARHASTRPIQVPYPAAYSSILTAAVVPWMTQPLPRQACRRASFR